MFVPLSFVGFPKTKTQAKTETKQNKKINKEPETKMTVPSNFSFYHYYPSESYDRYYVIL